MPQRSANASLAPGATFTRRFQCPWPRMPEPGEIAHWRCLPVYCWTALRYTSLRQASGRKTFLLGANEMNRRNVIGSIAAGAAVVASVGVASAADRESRFWWTIGRSRKT